MIAYYLQKITKQLLVHKLLAFASIPYTILLTVLSLLPQVGPSNMPSNSDKVFHTIAYFIFTIVWYLFFTYKNKISTKKAIIITVIYAIVFGIIIEILQHTLTQYRQADINDVIANTLGAILAVLIIKLVLKINVKYN